MYNATCRIISETERNSGSDGLSRDHGTRQRVGDLRCSLRPVSRNYEKTVLGGVGVNAYSCRVVTGFPVREGETLEALLDGAGEEWQEYTVRQVRPYGGYKSLLVERTP